MRTLECVVERDQPLLEYLNAGLVDEFSIAVSPVLFGAGVRLFDGVDRHRVSLGIVEAINSPLVTHLTYAVSRTELVEGLVP